MKRVILILGIVIFALPNVVFAMPNTLQAVYNSRSDLQSAFDENGDSIVGSAAGFLINFEDWALQYGWKVIPALADFAPVVEPPVGGDVLAPVVDAEAWIVVDSSSGVILGAKNAGAEWPIASITKLVTSDVVTKQTDVFDKRWSVLNSDNVGGARLRVDGGTSFTVRELLFATLVGSANNAANSISRVLGISRESFVGYMNDRVRTIGLRHTRLVDPTGIEVGNVSNAREVAKLALEVFKGNEMVRSIAQTVRKPLVGSDGVERELMTTNWMLYKPAYDDVWVMAGKTGFLYESRWNVVEMLRPSRNDGERELIVVVLGSQSRGESFYNVLKLSEWAWGNFAWGVE